MANGNFSYNQCKQTERIKKMTEQAQKCERKIKLFAFIPVYSWKLKGKKKVWKIFGLPLLKRKSNSNGSKIRYYFCGLPIMKVVRKYE